MNQHLPHDALFGNSSMLAGLPDANRAALLAECPVLTFPETTELLAQEEVPTGCYLIARGRVEISHVDRQGNVMILNVSGPGEVVGEAEIFSGQACVATCTALAGTVAMFCTAEALNRHVPAELLLRNISHMLHARLENDIHGRLIAQFSPPDQRICHHILQFTAPEAPETRLSQAYLASLAGCSRQTVNRRLGELRRDGVIEVKRETIRVLDRARLQTEAGI
ncbi:Crp/Fnr family transcriptional regulator [Pararhodobacter sp. CCB-MM2]|uniref:Crp/Fnr family transcriptional regulator n=1 Tax=Pararhodobacter sp. CCB-MM2 TaxID=1786003 RepID=UPI00082D6426|nr:Crp/Fnr family transcriptional regulator [Pararhodobacter sp. CCB-MM2]